MSATRKPLSLALAKASCHERMRAGSLSFHLATSLLGQRARDAIFMLYAWCRHCDDAIDGLPDGTDLATKRRVIDELIRETDLCYERVSEQNDVYYAFSYLVRSHRIPAFYPQELIRGMAMDAELTTYETFDELRLYCYRVAGVVGLMACHIFGISAERALAHASDLGLAMQLTNIARDVVDDARMGRCYLPRAWLDEAGIAPEELSDPRSGERLVPLARRLIEHAEGLYRSGEAGIVYLPWRAALAVLAARYIYAEIGTMVVERGGQAWDTRTWVPLPRKLRLVGKAFWVLLKSMPARWSEPWRPAPIHMIRRHP